MPHWKSLIFVIVMTAALLLAACAGTETEPGTDADSQPEESADAAERPDLLGSFTATDLNGDPADQSIFDGYELTMVNVWATFCGPCLQEMPDLGELAEEYSDQGVQIVGLVADVLESDGTISQEQVDLAREIVTETGANYLHLLPSEDLYGILAQCQFVPTTFFVDSEGKQVGRAYVQAMSKSQWKEVIQSVLAEMES
ncbi:MAG: TlpA disulfide reductase family protein [Bacillota bacterium]|nr:TlpA disulfide reductase family protein [Bacillota bacterium]